MNPTSFDDLGGKLRQVLVDAEALLRDTANTAGAKLDGAQQHARAALQRSCEHLRAAEHELATRAHRVERAVRDHPWETVAAVGITAFVLGLLVRRR